MKIKYLLFIILLSNTFSMEGTERKSGMLAHSVNQSTQSPQNVSFNISPDSVQNQQPQNQQPVQQNNPVAGQVLDLSNLDANSHSRRSSDATIIGALKDIYYVFHVN
jgi:hypothetical protein